MTTLDIRKAALRLAHQTIDSGGGSVSIVCGIPSPVNGYMVAIHGHEQSFPVESRTMATRVARFRTLAERYAERHRAVLSQTGNYLGSWIDGDRLVFDVSRNVFAFPEAVRLGWTTGQDAIYDLEAGRDILTSPGRRTTTNGDQERADELVRANPDWRVRWHEVRPDAPADAPADITTDPTPTPTPAGGQVLVIDGADVSIEFKRHPHGDTGYLWIEPNKGNESYGIPLKDGDMAAIAKLYSASGTTYSLTEVRNGTGWPKGSRFKHIITD